MNTNFNNNSIDYTMFGILIVMAVLFRIIGIVFWALIYGIFLMGRGALKNTEKNIKITKMDWIIILAAIMILILSFIIYYLLYFV